MFYFRIPHNILLLDPQILHKLLFSNAPGRTAYSLEHLKTSNDAGLGWGKMCVCGGGGGRGVQTRCNMRIG